MIATELKRAGATVFLALFCLLPALGPSVAAAQEPASDQDRVDQLMADYSGTEVPGALVAVVRNGEIVFERAYGMADLTHDIPFTANTRTNIGSTSKQFTAFAIALLADRGALSIDDDVRTHIPELPDFGETVRLRHLISHTSGYREFLNALAIGGWRLEEADHIDREEILAVVQRQPRLQNTPGSEYNYNNTGYALLAMVVERVTGEPFPEWMRANVFEPLGMGDTMVRGGPGPIVPNRAQGYAPAGDQGFREVTDIGAAMGAGGIYTTIGDLARWMRNLRTAELGGPAVLERMTTRNVLTTGDTTNYAMGLMVSRTRGLRMIQHGGADAAHRSTFVYYPDLDAGLIVQSNHAGFDGTIPGRIAEIFFGEHMEPGEETADPAAPVDFDPAAYDPAAFDVFVGRYELEDPAGLRPQLPPGGRPAHGAGHGPTGLRDHAHLRLHVHPDRGAGEPHLPPGREWPRHRADAPPERQPLRPAPPGRGRRHGGFLRLCRSLLQRRVRDVLHRGGRRRAPGHAAPPPPARNPEPRQGRRVRRRLPICPRGFRARRQGRRHQLPGKQRTRA
jgi:CubicO group peptidase (beta-lactamase class C family)